MGAVLSLLCMALTKLPPARDTTGATHWTLLGLGTPELGEGYGQRQKRQEIRSALEQFVATAKNYEGALVVADLYELLEQIELWAYSVGAYVKREMEPEYSDRFRAVTTADFVTPPELVQCLERTSRLPQGREHYLKLYPRRRILETFADEMG